MSRGRAVVTTSLGLEGLEEHRDAVRVADGAAAFADALVGLLEDPRAVAGLGHGPRASPSRLSWPAAMTPLRDLLTSLRLD